MGLISTVAFASGGDVRAQAVHATPNVTSTAGYAERSDKEAIVQGRALLKRVAGCIYRQDRASALDFLTTLPGSNREYYAYIAVRSRLQQCLHPDDLPLHADRQQIRGELAEIAFAQSFPSFIPGNVHQIVPLPVDWTAKSSDRDTQVGLMSATFANCVVAVDPEHAVQLLSSEPSSPSEARVIAALAPALNPCLPSGAKLTMDAASLRALVAQALYRSASVWAVQTPSAGGRG